MATLAIAIVLVAASPALAHVPAIEPSRSSDAPPTSESRFPGAVPIDPPEASAALYGYLAEDERFDVFTFVLAETIETDVNVLVPRGESDFRPMVTVASEDGTVASAGTGKRTPFFEVFTLESLLQSPSRVLTLEAGKRYYVRVAAASRQRSGRYVVAFGGPEAFTPEDIRDTASYLPRIYLGLYGQAPLKALPCLPLVGGLALGAALALLRWRRLRPPKVHSSAGGGA